MSEWSKTGWHTSINELVAVDLCFKPFPPLNQHGEKLVCIHWKFSKSHSIADSHRNISKLKIDFWIFGLNIIAIDLLHRWLFLYDIVFIWWRWRVWCVLVAGRFFNDIQNIVMTCIGVEWVHGLVIKNTARCWSKAGRVYWVIYNLLSNTVYWEY